MKLALVVAMARNGVIGREGTLPWHLPADLQRFRAITMGKPIVMGRRTHESIGRPLPGRRNIILSSAPDYVAAGCEVFASLDAALTALAAVDEVMIVGGAALYAEALPRAARLYLTDVEATLDGDVFFPAFDRAQWREVAHEPHDADERNEHAYCFRVLERISQMAPPSST
ncbi:MAG: type 3 dihydrofolate reductase [Gammaproteobacteria bacterium]|nr:type 3 dihydrofolate reductase [Gammaproteobacteria bacterium]